MVGRNERYCFVPPWLDTSIPGNKRPADQGIYIPVLPKVTKVRLSKRLSKYLSSKVLLQTKIVPTFSQLTFVYGVKKSNVK